MSWLRNRGGRRGYEGKAAVTHDNVRARMGTEAVAMILLYQCTLGICTGNGPLRSSASMNSTGRCVESG